MNYPGFCETWDVAACEEAEIVGRILTGKLPEQYQPDEALLDVVGFNRRDHIVLDFGCGMGRNLLGMARRGWWCVGYDNPSMIAVAKTWLAEHATEAERRLIWLHSDWDTVMGLRFDTILCSLVLQHMLPDDIAAKVADFRHLAKRLIVAGRDVLDDHATPVWSLIEDYFDAPSVAVAWTPPPDKFGHQCRVYEREFLDD